MSGDEKTSLDQIVAGDEVAYYPYGGFHARVLRREKVERVTATWIILEYGKFHRKNGYEVGAEPYRRDEIYPLGMVVDGITYAERVECAQEKAKDDRRRQELAEWIADRLRGFRLNNLTVDQLEQAAKLLGFE